MEAPFQILCSNNDSKLFKQAHKRSKKESATKHSSYLHKPRKARQDKLDKKHLQSCKLWKVTRAKARETKDFIVELNQIAGININLANSNDGFENCVYKCLYDELWDYEDDVCDYNDREWYYDMYKDQDYDERSFSCGDYDDWDRWDELSLTLTCGTRKTRM
jgi:hypothetical protein